jgi:tRNA (guanine37-N1)-methyltransferase
MEVGYPNYSSVCALTYTSQDISLDPMSLFRPPIIRSAGAALDRSLFTKRILIAAARVLDIKNVSKYRNQLEKSKDLLKLDRLANVRPDPDTRFASKGGKCLLLNPVVKPGGMYE